MNAIDFDILLAQRLRTARRAAGLTQEQAAARLAVTRSQIAMIETARSKVSAAQVAAFAQLYQQSVAYFYGEMTAYNPIIQAPAYVADEARALAQLLTAWADRQQDTRA